LLLAPLPLPLYAATVLLLFLIGIPLCGRAARALGHDHPSIVWDEMVGYLATMTAAPRGWPWIVLGFVLFRAFDILKPWPIRAVDERLSGGIGIMLDDLLAGAYAWGVMALWQGA
ncbi:MAG: phosphatidylglycerophosphatase A, partial [Gammaproteobacteria bacterium]